MTTTGTPRSEPRPGQPPVRRASRDLRGAVLGGVAAGLAEHLRVPVLWLRAGFVLTTPLGGLGVALYGAYWLLLPVGSAFRGTDLAPGVAAAGRDGRRAGAGQRRWQDLGPALVLVALALGLLLTVQAVVGGAATFWPVAVGVAGLALRWRQADEAQRERWFDPDGLLHPAQIVVGRGGWAGWARVLAGLALVLAAVVVMTFDDGSLAQARGALIGGGLGILGLAVVLGPWVWRLAAELSDERAERVRTQDRADVAAHLHDSVLQTLALIQKNADDPAAVARLARAQERDLRRWLYTEGSTPTAPTLARALREHAAEVEDAHGVSVEVVVVGDADLGDPRIALPPLVAAAREAMANAAEHAGVSRVDVFAEVGEAGVEVFVRDRGRGFDLAVIDPDRLGVRRSILDRMVRHGGRAEVRSAPGEGTEVRLSVDRTDSAGWPPHHEGSDLG
ncbi:PspC domain-containing protein [Nocardioides sp.]|uniref:ATP-binding protein n=1 Tax=Nocardioides sp. TaxID=35761 RepID=UPI003513F9B0